MQSTPSFKFTWGKSNAITGKVLRKKQQVPVQEGATAVKTTKAVFKKTKDRSNLSNNNNSDISVDLTKPSSHDKTVHIKRKHKKDKQNVQAGANESEGTHNEGKNVKVNSSKSFSLYTEKPKEVYVKSQTGKSVSEKVFTESGSKFGDLDIHKHLASNLQKINFTTLTTVQEKAIPVVLSGKDVLIRSQTGSGKTLAYAVPIIDALLSITPRLQRKDGVQAIIVVPTRELALQTHELFKKINTFQWIVTGHLCGGENRKTEKERLRKGVHILIGTPGRLLDHVMHTNALKIDSVRCLVLDEADRLLDMGFRKDIVSLVETLTKVKEHSQYDPVKMLKSSTQNVKIKFDDSDEETSAEKDVVPLRNIKSKKRQTLLLSATLTKDVSELADFAMKDHVFVDALGDVTNSDNNMQVGNLVIPDTVRQEFILTYVKHRLFTLSALLAAKCKKSSKMFVFMASTQMVEFHYELFTRCLVKMPVNRGKLKTGNVVLFDNNSDLSDNDEEEVVLNVQFFKLHGNMDQKIRKEVFTQFRAAKTGVLLCTDVAARGLDVPAADCIVQYTGPQTDEDYLHRVGRTGRAGQLGSAIIFLTHEEQEYVSHLGEHRVFLKQRKPEEFLKHLCDVMQEPDCERAAEALQRHYENAISKNKALHLSACFAYSTWSRFYNSYPAKMRSMFNFKKINLGHYATSFGLRDPPSQISGIVRGQVANAEAPKLNKKLSNHMEEGSATTVHKKPKQKRSISLITSEYSSGLEPPKKKTKKKSEESQ